MNARARQILRDLERNAAAGNVAQAARERGALMCEVRRQLEAVRGANRILEDELQQTREHLRRWTDPTPRETHTCPRVLEDIVRIESLHESLIELAIVVEFWVYAEPDDGSGPRFRAALDRAWALTDPDRFVRSRERADAEKRYADQDGAP